MKPLLRGLIYAIVSFVVIGALATMVAVVSIRGSSVNAERLGEIIGQLVIAFVALPAFIVGIVQQTRIDSRRRATPPPLPPSSVISSADRKRIDEI
jgi:hypothetical protein